MLVLIICFFVTFRGTLSSNVSDASIPTPQHYCFKIISANERLVAYTVSRIVERKNLEGCEQECNILKCTYFSFGVFGNSNGTCELTTDRQISRRRDFNFDLYERTNECVQGKPTGYERACYRRLESGKRLHERFIRHSLPCNALEACQHQCSIEKRFDCHGFNIRLDSARVGKGICELSSISSRNLDPSQDFIFDPEFSYYERVYDSDLPNCGYVAYPINTPFRQNSGESEVRYNNNPQAGGPYYGGDSYGPWSTGYGTENYGPWGSHGYGSGFYVPNNPRKEPPPIQLSNTPFRYNSYNYGEVRPFQVSERQGPGFFREKPNWSFSKYPYDGSRRYGRPENVPTYIIIDADVSERNRGRNDINSKTPNSNLGYLPPQSQSLPPIKQSPLNLPSETPDPSLRSSNFPTLSTNSPSFDKSTPSGQTASSEGSLISSPQPSNYPRPQNLPSDFKETPTLSSPYPTKSEELPPRLPVPFSTSPRTQITPHYNGPGFSPYGPSRKASGNFPIFEQEVCFQRAHPGYRLNPASIRSMFDAPTVLECEAICTGSPFRCTGYSFRYSTSNNEIPNCLLTDFTSLTPESNLLQDRSCDVYFKMNPCANFERISRSECFLKVASNRRIDSNKIAKSVWAKGISDCEFACLSAGHFICRSFTFRHGPRVIGESLENCFLSDWPITALSLQDYILSPNYEIYERGSYGHGCELDAGSNYIGPESPLSGYSELRQVIHNKGLLITDNTWKHFTVSGWPCKIGTECQLNSVAGFWFCEVEGGNGEQWDYCCRPKHACGYSRGFNYPWCYVGEAGPQQWRPCSEHYYPEPFDRFQYKPAQSYNTNPADSYDSPRDERPWDFGDDLGPKSYWPISYLYTDPPPNETYYWEDDHDDDGYFHNHNYKDVPLEHLHHEEHYEEDSPTIKFKPCSHRFPYPKAIIQKLDLKNVVKENDPEENSQTNDKSKKSDSLLKIPISDVVLGFSSNNQLREIEKNQNNYFSTEKYPYKNETEIIVSKKREIFNTTESKNLNNNTEILIGPKLQESNSEPTEVQVKDLNITNLTNFENKTNEKH